VSISRVIPPIAALASQSRPPDPGAPADVRDGIMPRRWTFLRSAAADGVTNMAIDAALLSLAGETSCAVWRCYAWERPTISFGRNERTRGRFSPDRLREAGLGAVRRPTGGRALLHAREVTYSVAMPLDEQLSWRVAYTAVNAVLLGALQSLGVPARLVEDHEAQAVPPDGPVCFDRPAAGEITVDGRKLVGSAVWRQGRAYLQHGSILLADDQSRLTGAADVPLPPSPPAASLEDCAPSHARWAVVVDALAASLAAATSPEPPGEIPPFVPPSDFPARVASHRARLGHDDWLWRR
jgi:lipoate-protein ligase A